MMATDYIVYRKDLSLKEAQATPALDPPPQRVIKGGYAGFSGDGSGTLCGVASGAVEAHDFPTGRGLRVTRRVKAGEIVLTVPLEQCWSAGRARRCPELSGLDSIADEDILALHLLIERCKGPGGWNAAHIISLPTAFDMTSFWSNEELAELDENLLNTSRKLSTQVGGDFATVVDAVRSAGRASLLMDFRIDIDGYRWAKAVLWSRCCDLKVDQNAMSQRFLVPGFDLANHDPLMPVSHGVRDGHVFIRAPRDQEEGEEICINYGSHLNSHLITWYGFVLDENPAEGTTIEFPVNASEAEHLKNIGAGLREDESNAGKVFARCTMSFRDPLPVSMVFAAAICNGICQSGQTSLTEAQEIESLEMLTKIIPAKPGLPPLPAHSDYRRRCATVLRTMDDRIFEAFHAALQKRKLALVPKKKK